MPDDDGAEQASNGTGGSWSRRRRRGRPSKAEGTLAGACPQRRCRHGGGLGCGDGNALIAQITSDRVSHAQCHTARSESSNQLYASTNLGEYRSNCQWWQSSKNWYSERISPGYRD